MKMTRSKKSCCKIATYPGTTTSEVSTRPTYPGTTTSEVSTGPTYPVRPSSCAIRHVSTAHLVAPYATRVPHIAWGGHGYQNYHNNRSNYQNIRSKHRTAKDNTLFSPYWILRLY
eukprot:1057664-Rhodomonas_salina.1